MENYTRFSCENCFFKVKTQIKNVGKEGVCPNCGKITIIPDGTEESIYDVDISHDLEELAKFQEEIK